MRRLICLTMLTFFLAASAFATVPAGFTQTTVTSSLSVPTAMAMAPDGRIFVCQQSGALRVVKNGTLLTTPFVSLTVDSNGERGLLGVAFDPDFLNNQYVYVYYTTPTPSVHNRISRFTASGDVAAGSSELVLLDLDNLSGATNHNGGAIHFGLDGKLYAAAGENANGANSQTLTNLLGKILRLNSDGSIPSDNPFFNSATGNNRLIWALGLRNPFTFNVHPISGRIFIDDVGQATWEEIDDGLAGANYGWPNTEGATSNPAYVSPLYSYGHSPACAIAGGTFYAPEVRQFPSAMVDSYFFSDLCAGWIHRLDQTYASNDFATSISQPVDLMTGPDGSLYYLTHGGTLGRIRSNKHAVGDVNNDGETNNKDVFYLINYFYNGGPAPVQGGDVDGSGQLTTADLTYLAAYVDGRGPAPM